jgi:ABC-type phosphate transport system auxiliary subunit
VQHDIENGRIKEEKEQIKLMAEIEFQGRLDSARADADRRKADFLKKIRSLHQKKQELAEAEAEYKSTR